MINLLDWLLEKMKLVDDEEKEQEVEADAESMEKSWLELVHWKKDNVLDSSRYIFCKNIMMYADSQEVIDNYKLGAVCIFRLSPSVNQDVQAAMNYVRGGIYALDGEIKDLGERVFIAIHKNDEIL